MPTTTNSQSETRLQTNGWGVDLTYQDAFGKWHETPPQTLAAITKALGADPDALAPPDQESLLIVRAGEQRELSRPVAIRLENGEEITAEQRLPPDLPCGYHTISFDNGGAPVRLIVSPCQCWLPEHLETWGFAVQLYSARSRESWGIGDFGDLERLARWSAADLGAGMALLNPLSAASPFTPQQSSPYFPTSRRFFNPLWIHVEWVPGASGTVPQLEQLARAGRDLNSARRIDRDRIFELKMRALEILWLQFPGDGAFDAFCQQHGTALDRFATFCVLAERHRSGWHSWPEPFRHPASQAVTRFATENQPRILFYKWLQWLL
ncbi:MAG: 4-alpha-glucanotransferase, partial [Acidobacteriaceae bacterium]|nr:4-alpha-glucanotransferase [Acidobacteriaceae bacterium]